MASHFDDGDGDDTDFEEYDSDPYDGGYDIVLTYGRPIPPSPATCYPISQGSGHLPEPPAPPLPLPPPVESGHRPEPQDPAPRPASPSPPPVLNQHPVPSYDFGYRPENYWPDPDVFGFWPFVSERWRRWDDGADVEEVGYWSQWKRAGDYLFGYLQGYGERRIGVDSYGIPIYADKKEASHPPLTLQMEPAMDFKVDCYENDTWSSSYVEKKVESYGHAYNKYYSQEPRIVEENLSEPTLHQRLAYHEVYEEQADPKLEWWSSSYVEKQVESYGHAYNKYYSQEPLIVEENLTELTLHQRLVYHEVYEEQADPKLEWYFFAGHGVGDESNFSSEPNDTYRRQYHELPNYVQLEPFRPSWAQNPTFYDSYVQEVSQSSWDGLLCLVIITDSITIQSYLLILAALSLSVAV